jgi:4-diphosphocytidyl-2-C-methyl-D-erythritol kinase
VEEWRGRVINDFELKIFRNYPRVAELKMALYDAGAVYASMSGSGSVVYGIFREVHDLPPYLIKSMLISAEL